MEKEVERLRKSLGGFCNHLQSSCDAFNDSLHRRPIPLDSASSTFIKSLNRRLSTAGSELNFLDSMSFGTVSFEELLGHCNQIYKNNLNDSLHLQERLSDFGYVPETEIEFGAFDNDLEPHSSIITSLDLLDDSLNLKNLGLSDACLATLASSQVKDPDTCFEESAKKGQLFDTSPLHPPKALELSNENEMDKAIRPSIRLIKEEYESLPSYMKSLASWEDLINAVEKFNSILGSKKQRNGSYYFPADEIPTLGLGNKEKAYTVLLTRMKRLVLETLDGVVSYRVT